MAPTSPIKRVTRARAAAKSTKDDAAPKKLGTTKVTKAAATTTKPATAATKATTRKPPTEYEPEDEMIEAAPPKKPTRTAAKPAAPLTAAPRRRVKVTPLNAPIPEEPAPEAAPEKPKRKTTTSKSKKAAEPVASAEEEPVEPTTRSRATRNTAATTSKKTATKAATSDLAAPKTRGRPKKETAQPGVTEEPESVTVKTTRQTRTRSASVASQQPVETIEVLPKSKPGTRKKVTFQDVSEDDKENEQVAPRRATAKKAAPASGMRAKPVRKPAAASAKKTTATRSRVAKAEPRALTPKKITQVQRAASADDSDDELNGAKTPVRDLSLSPKRNPNLASQLSPVKRLDFTQTLTARSPAKLGEKGIMSPARRPASPVKAGADETVATAMAAPPTPGLQQSPKRGVLDASIFPHSAIKSQRSPLKESLLQSPARRLFSPAKQKAPLSVHRDTENTVFDTDMETVEEIAVSSHFRPSMSPQRAGRVHRMSDEELADELAMDMDFDQSVLKLTSPKKSPVKALQSIVSEALDEEPQMQVIQNDIEETAKAVEELQGPEDSPEPEVGAGVAIEETIEPAQVSLSATDDSSEEPEEENTIVQQAPQGRGKAPRLSQILFRSNRFREEEESSDDELAADQTPDRAPRLFRSSMTGNNTRSRLSMGVQQREGGNTGFTPLAAQMSGWLANSPEKTPNKAPQGGLFSPVAAQHIAGEIQISRQSTPQTHKSSSALRTSVNSRPSMTPSALGSPEMSTFFAEQMSAMEESFGNDTTVSDEHEAYEMDATGTDAAVAVENAAIFEELQHLDEHASAEADEEDDTVVVNNTGEELTTDLVNEIHASDTAMVDFEELAQEAAVLAEADDEEAHGSSEYGDENAVPEETLNLSVMERETTPEDPTLNLHVMEQADAEETTLLSTPAVPQMSAADEPTLNLQVLEESALNRSTSATPVARSHVAIDEPTLNIEVLERNVAAATPRVHNISDEQTLNLHVLEQNALQRTPGSMSSTSVSEGDKTPEGSPEPTTSPSRSVLALPSEHMATPVGRDLSGPRLVNTVISKVPLKPEADESPIKMPKKRSRSMSMSKQQSPAKRAQLQPFGELAARSTSAPISSPDRQIRIAGPSPAHSTPGQMSFAIDDFGDSTLDGIELPDDEMDFDVGRPAETPVTVKSAKTTRSFAATPARTPLKTVGQGVLHGAVVFVEVHTSEGADASGVYVDLLTQLGARCVKEWRWNPRSSVHGGDDPLAASKIGITHVVYKDGGKRTLEKVRDAKGEVSCVGVRWVLE